MKPEIAVSPYMQWSTQSRTSSEPDGSMEERSDCKIPLLPTKLNVRSVTQILSISSTFTIKAYHNPWLSYKDVTVGFEGHLIVFSCLLEACYDEAKERKTRLVFM